MAVQKATATIAAGATESNPIFVGEYAVVRISFPGMTSTSITFKSSEDNITYAIIKDKDNATYTVTLTAATPTSVQVNPVEMISPQWLKIISGSIEAATRSVIVYFMEL